MRIQHKIFSLLEAPKRDNPILMWFDRALVALIILNLLAVTFETVDDVYYEYLTEFYYFKIFSIFVFSVEYILRVWSCTENPGGKYASPFIGRLKYMVSPLALIDLLAILPFYLSIITAVDPRFMRIFRLLWILKFTRNFHVLETMRRVFIRESGTLTALLIVLSSLLYDNKRTATVVALTYTELLQLNVNDFKKLLDENPKLKEYISTIALKRMSIQ